jgi:hypothetical protein
VKMREDGCWRLTACAVFAFHICGCSTGHIAQRDVVLDGSSKGRTFEGLGLSAPVRPPGC